MEPKKSVITLSKVGAGANRKRGDDMLTNEEPQNAEAPVEEAPAEVQQ